MFQAPSPEYTCLCCCLVGGCCFTNLPSCQRAGHLPDPGTLGLVRLGKFQIFLKQGCLSQDSSNSSRSAQILATLVKP